MCPVAAGVPQAKMQATSSTIEFAQTAVVSLVALAALALLGLVLAYWTWEWFAPSPEPRAQAAQTGSTPLVPQRARRRPQPVCSATRNAPQRRLADGSLHRVARCRGRQKQPRRFRPVTRAAARRETTSRCAKARNRTGVRLAECTRSRRAGTQRVRETLACRNRAGRAAAAPRTTMTFRHPPMTHSSGDCSGAGFARILWLIWWSASDGPGRQTRSGHAQLRQRDIEGVVRA